MKKNGPTVVSFLLLAFIVADSRARQENPLASLVNAEVAFSRLSEIKGIREAFLACLAEDAVVFRPGPLNGKKFYAEQKDISGFLTWKPVFADISDAGDLGYTTGPYEFWKNKVDKESASHGHYVSVWRKEKNAGWKVVIDFGVGHPPLKVAPPVFSAFPAMKAAPQGSIRAVDIEKERAALWSRDLKLGQPGLTGHGFSQSYFSALAPEIRLYRPNAYPYLGAAEARKALETASGEVAWKPEKAIIAESGDFGYTYGTFFYRVGPAEKERIFHYLRIWKKSADQVWKIALEVSNFVPAKTNA